MIMRPDAGDYKIIGHYLGKVVIGIGILMLVPIAVAFIYGEMQPAIDYLFSMGVTLMLGFLLTIVCYTKDDLGTMHAMAVASLAWVAAMFVSAMPLYLGGCYSSYLDACFEAMSGYATTGLTLVVNLDHMANAHNFWRHFIMFMGGQGIVVIALTFLFKGTSGAFKMYLGEARDERILPNVIETARFIWVVSIVYLIIGSSALAVSAYLGGLAPGKAIFDSICVFMAAWDTGGFTPQSQNILFYHNFSFEIISLAIMLLGSINFALHYAVWTGNRRELFKNIEIRSLFISMVITLSITAGGVAAMKIYGKSFPFFSKTFFHLISAHTGTGYSTIYPVQFGREWGQLAMTGIICAMAIGGSVCSTTGAIKLLRLGIIYKAIRQDIKRLMIPDTAILIETFHHIKDTFLEDRHVRSAALILLAYVTTYLLGTVAGMCYGYSFIDASFESVSATANVGLSCGVTIPSMPAGLKVIYIIQMWAGRLEFMSILILIAMVVASIKGKR